MKLYLVHHGDAVAKEIDADRPLTQTGRQDLAIPRNALICAFSVGELAQSVTVRSIVDESGNSEPSSRLPGGRPERRDLSPQVVLGKKAFLPQIIRACAVHRPYSGWFTPGLWRWPDPSICQGCHSE